MAIVGGCHLNLIADAFIAMTRNRLVTAGNSELTEMKLTILAKDFWQVAAAHTRLTPELLDLAGVKVPDVLY